MKLANLAVLLVLISVVAVSGCIGQSSEPAVSLDQNTEKFVTYNDQKYGVKISYPESWVQKETSYVFLFASPKGESVSLIYSSMDNTTLNEFTENIRENIGMLSVDEALPEIKKTMLSGKPGYYVIYNSRLGNINIKIMQAWTIADGSAYTLTYGSSPKDFSQSLGERIINSFAFVK